MKFTTRILQCNQDRTCCVVIFFARKVFNPVFISNLSGFPLPRPYETPYVPTLLPAVGSVDDSLDADSKISLKSAVWARDHYKSRRHARSQ